MLLSAGVGMTPLMSILETLEANGDRRKISWVHGTRNSKVQAFQEHIQEMARKNGHMRKDVFYSSPLETENKGEDYEFEGRLDLKKLKSREDLMLYDEHARYYICGPEGFMADWTRR